eukprot:scaffold273196_cov20-Prasinocladus_malaysianus.AAC.1
MFRYHRELEGLYSTVLAVHEFPLLAGPNGGSILEKDLGVSSALHRDKILRAVKRQMLGLGHAPGAPQVMERESLQRMEI